MGALLSRLDCGVLEVLTGDPDWTIDARGIRHSAARHARAQSDIEQNVRDKVARRESLCREYEIQIADATLEAVRCGRVVRTPSAPVAQKRAAMARAKKALQMIAQSQQRLKREQIVIQQARSHLDRINVVQRGDEDRVLFQELHALTKGVDVTDAKLDDIEKAGQEVVDGHDQLAEFEASMNDTVQLFDKSMNATADGAEFDLNDESQLLAALSQLEEQEIDAAKDATAYTFKTAEASTSLKVPDAPTYVPQAPKSSARVAVAVTTSGVAVARHTEPTARSKKQKAVHDDLHDVF